MIRKLQKETLKLKAVNTVQYRKLSQTIIKTRREEKQMAQLLATDHKNKIKEIKNLIKR